MDLRQIKLTRLEWNTIEKPVSQEEKQILTMIDKGYYDVDIHYNNHTSMLLFLKINNNFDSMHYYLYDKYFNKIINKIKKKYYPNLELSFETQKIKKLNSTDSIKVQNLDDKIAENKQYIFEYILLDLCSYILKYINKGKTTYTSYLYSLIQIQKSSIKHINIYVIDFIKKVIEIGSKNVTTKDILKNAVDYIERNDYIMKYKDKTLYKHQKDIYEIFKTNKHHPKLVLYSAPTGTGKTMTPIGLSNKHKVIFVCVARHIGLALAKSAITMGKKIAFAFGCDEISDIRLHYYAAKDYIKHSINPITKRCYCGNPVCKKEGRDIKYKDGTKKIDNTNGSNVEIIICDVRSYITSMKYMMKFNHVDEIVTYWDEPTITLDNEEHELHETIKNTWQNNEIPNVVLSCATLPKQTEIGAVIEYFKRTYSSAVIYDVNSYDFAKTIPILSKDSICMTPHSMYEKYDDLKICVEYCKNNKTLLRYIDLDDILQFIYFVNKNEYIQEACKFENQFDNNIGNITMNTIKEYYLLCLENIKEEYWDTIYTHVKQNEKCKFANYNLKRTTSLPSDQSNNDLYKTTELTRTQSVFEIEKPKNDKKCSVLFTTQDAHTLTDGPTIYLCENVNRICKFYVQQSHIPIPEFQKLLAKINKNNTLSKKIESLENDIKRREEMTSNNDDDTGKTKVVEKRHVDKETQQMMNEVDKLRKQVLYMSLDHQYIPNSVPHQEKWVGNVIPNAFNPTISEDNVKDIMLLNIDNSYKILLLMGIGVLLEHHHQDYNEIMKRMAEEQMLFMIIASSDYIYGTNYQFCHGILGKDLDNMTQQKTMQALGRIGRNAIQQEYTVRFRNDELVYKLFKTQEHNTEAINMNKLFG